MNVEMTIRLLQKYGKEIDLYSECHQKGDLLDEKDPDSETYDYTFTEIRLDFSFFLADGRETSGWIEFEIRSGKTVIEMRLESGNYWVNDDSRKYASSWKTGTKKQIKEEFVKTLETDKTVRDIRKLNERMVELQGSLTQ